MADCFTTNNNNNNNEFRFDRLEVSASALFRPNGQDDQFRRSSFFCGVGLGRNNGQGGNNNNNLVNDDGLDGGDGVLVRSPGPFVLRFVSDSLGPDTSNNNNNNNDDADVTSELGFAVDYALETSCPDVTEVVN